MNEVEFSDIWWGRTPIVRWIGLRNEYVDYIGRDAFFNARAAFKQRGLIYNLIP